MGGPRWLNGWPNTHGGVHQVGTSEAALVMEYVRTAFKTGVFFQRTVAKQTAGRATGSSVPGTGGLMRNTFSLGGKDVRCVMLPWTIILFSYSKFMSVYIHRPRAPRLCVRGPHGDISSGRCPHWPWPAPRHPRHKTAARKAGAPLWRGRAWVWSASSLRSTVKAKWRTHTLIPAPPLTRGRGL